MSQLLPELGNNIAYLLALTFIYGLLNSYLNRYPALTQSIIRGVLFGLFGIIVVFNTTEIVPGYYLDGRSIVILMAGMFGGGVSGLIAVFFTIVYRISLGGGGVLPSILSALSCVALGIWIYHQRRLRALHVTLPLLILLGVILVIVYEFWTLLFVGEMAGQYLQTTLIPALIVFPVGTVLLGLLLFRQESQEKIEAALQQSEERYRLMVTTMNDGIAVLDSGGTIINCNPSAERILGMSREQLIGNSLFDPRWEAIHEDGSVFQTDEYPGIVTLRTGQPQLDIILGVKKPDQSFAWIEICTYPLFAAGRPSPATVFATFNDVTERRQSQAKLRQERDLLRTLIDSSLDYIFIKDAEGRFVLSNTAHAQAGNVNADDLVGKTAFDFFPTDLASQYHADDQHIMASGQPLINMERATLGADGQPRTVLTSKIPLRDEDGNIIGLVGISRDITERKQFEFQAMELAAERERANVLQRFISDMSHDFRTPLSIISSSLYLIKKNTDPQRQLVHMDKLEEQVLRLSKLLDGVLEMSNLDRLDVQFQFQPADLNAMVEQLVHDFEPMFSAAQLTAEFQAECDPCIAEVDQVEVTRAVISLLENAAAYTEPGGRVSIRTRLQQDMAEISVQDTGIGIDAEQRPHIFDRFYRADPARSMATGGNGLGLSIVQAVAQAHGGSIEVESAVGQGSTFTLKLPVAQTTGVHEDGEQL